MISDHKWLENWVEQIEGRSVLELGAGPGLDTQYLNGIVGSLIATDLVGNEAKGTEALDHSQPLPYASNRFDVVIASLCLHYFKWGETEDIVCELHRVLKPNGILIGRVNSVADVNFGAMGYPEVEPGLYDVKGQTKRFFNKTDLERLFQAGWVMPSIEDQKIDRYDMEKAILEFVAVRA